jgi:hypothetical protein
VSPLESARAAVAHDLHSPAYDGQVNAAVEHRTWWLEQWPAGAPHVLGLLAQDVQESVALVDPLWPLCPEPGCRETAHPLHIEPDLGPDPFWVCARSGLPVAPVGSLAVGPPQPRRR